MPSFPLKYLVPNAVTALSLLLGLASVAASAQGDYELAAWMVLWCTLLDKADGTAARLLDATSKFGVEFDSFADFVSFGIAPAALFYFRLSHGEAPRALVIFASALYALALAARLARFNITTSGESVFQGVPGTLMGGVLAAGYLAFHKYHVPDAIIPYTPAFAILGAVLMVSTLRIPKLKLRKNKLFNAFQLFNMASAYILAPLRLFPEYLFGLSTLYLVGGLIAGAMSAGEAEPEASEQKPA
jgi:CDP-diacylglycerol--serine O-phosphatidyltransferase